MRLELYGSAAPITNGALSTSFFRVCVDRFTEQLYVLSSRYHKICIPFQMVFIISLCDLMFLVEVFCHLTSGMIICIITIERYLHITSVSQRATVKSRLKYTGILCVIMLISTVISCLHLVGIGNSQVYYPGSWCFLTTSMFTFVLLWGSLPVSNWFSIYSNKMTFTVCNVSSFHHCNSFLFECTSRLLITL